MQLNNLQLRNLNQHLQLNDINDNSDNDNNNDFAS